MEKKIAETKLTVSRTVKSSGKEEALADREQVVEIHQFATEPAKVVFDRSIKLTKNYNSAGTTIGVVLPCYLEEIPEAAKKAQSLVDEALKKELPDLLNLLNKLSDVTNR